MGVHSTSSEVCLSQTILPACPPDNFFCKNTFNPNGIPNYKDIQLVKRAQCIDKLLIPEFTEFCAPPGMHFRDIRDKEEVGKGCGMIRRRFMQRREEWLPSWRWCG